MVARKMLEQLGWSDELIDEITRTSGQMEGSIPLIHAIGAPETYASTVSSTSIEASPEITTSTSLFFEPDRG